MDITAYIHEGQWVTQRYKLIKLLIAEIGPQDPSYQGDFFASGVGWHLTADFSKPGRTSWELYIHDEQLALMFKLKWL